MELHDVFKYHSGGLLSTTPDDQPWRLDGWVFATNGHVLVALTDDGRTACEPPEKVKAARKYLVPEPEHSCRVSLAALRKFTGKAQGAVIECDDCGGSGRSDWADSVTCEHCGQATRRECSACGGDGKGSLKIRYAHVVEVPVNLSLLAYGLQFAPTEDSDVTVGQFKDATAKALAVCGEGWRVVLMCLRDAPQDAPRFDAATERR